MPEIFVSLIRSGSSPREGAVITRHLILGSGADKGMVAVQLEGTSVRQIPEYPDATAPLLPWRHPLSLPVSHIGVGRPETGMTTWLLSTP